MTGVGLPLGGTTGMDHVATEAIELAGRWLASHADTTGRAIVPEIRTRFDLTTAEAIRAIRRANDLRRAI